MRDSWLSTVNYGKERKERVAHAVVSFQNDCNIHFYIPFHFINKMIHPALFALSIQAADESALGRVNPGALSDQDLMELLIEGICENAKKEYQDSHGAYLDISEWNGVELDENSRVVSVGAEERTCNGTVALAYIPTLVTRFALFESHARGTLDTSQLPEGLDTLMLFRNEFHGDVGLTALPKNLREFNISENEFSGSCDLTSLPASIELVNVARNAFSGTLDFSNLPPKIFFLFLEHNTFSGEVRCAALPAELRMLWVHNNALTGAFRLDKAPEVTREIRAEHNSFSGTAYIDAAASAGKRISLHDNNIVAVVTEKGEKHTNEYEILNKKKFAFG